MSKQKKTTAKQKKKNIQKEKITQKENIEINKYLNDPHAFTRFDKKNNKSRAFSLHKLARKRFPVRSYRAKYKNQFWQADLEEMIPYAKENAGYKYILTIIDVFSRFAWAWPLKYKNAETVVEAFKIVINDYGAPKYLHTDQGKEFENKTLRNFLVTTKQFSVKSQFKAALVERFNRTLKGRMYKYFTFVGNYKWFDILHKIVDGYNNTYHTTIKMTPSEAYQNKNRKRVFLLQEKRISQKKKDKTLLKVGDYVRLSKAKNIFEKGFVANWTEEIFQIHRVHKKYSPVMYTIKDKEKNILEGKFYKYELQKVARPRSFAIEKIIESKGNRIQVKFLGYKQPEWILRSDIISLNNE